jgi:chromosome segregation ATPase
MKTDITKKIADLLPGDLTEETVVKIADLFEQKITEEIKQEVDRLTIKFNSLLRANVDALKEQAIAELEESDGQFRKIQMFEAVSNLMAVELVEEDKDRALVAMAEETALTNQEVEVLIEEIKNLSERENVYERTIKALNDKLENISESYKGLREELSNLNETKQEPFHSSEKAKFFADSDKEVKNQPVVENEFLTEAVINLTR